MHYTGIIYISEWYIHCLGQISKRIENLKYSYRSLIYNIKYYFHLINLLNLAGIAPIYLI